MDRNGYKKVGYNIPTIDMNASYSLTGSSDDPTVFGPSMWFTFHNGARAYPKNPTEFIKSGMKQLISNIPLIMPCVSCKEHFYAFLKSIDLDWAVASRDNLFEFWVNAHNYVNDRYGKRLISLDEAKQYYGFNNPNGSMMRLVYSGK
jgi:hypothetical protein